MPTIGPLELLVILIIALIVFGPKRLPELGASLGRGIREFRSSVASVGEDEEPEERRASRRPELQSSEAPREETGGRVDDEDLAREKRE